MKTNKDILFDLNLILDFENNSTLDIELLNGFLKETMKLEILSYSFSYIPTKFNVKEVN